MEGGTSRKASEVFQAASFVITLITTLKKLRFLVVCLHSAPKKNQLRYTENLGKNISKIEGQTGRILTRINDKLLIIKNDLKVYHNIFQNTTVILRSKVDYRQIRFFLLEVSIPNIFSNKFAVKLRLPTKK